jgi:curved DNA binding protein
MADIDSDDEERAATAPKTEVKEEVKEEDTSLANDAIVNKYQEAARIAQAVLIEVSALCIVGARVVDICRTGDNLIESKAALVYNKKTSGRTVEKGIAFPVCVSVNECVCHSSPLESDTLTPALKLGDLVKIDLGAHTVRVGISGPLTDKVEGPLADVFHAAWAAAEVAARMIKPGNTNAMVTAAVKKVAEAYGVNAIAGTLMHQMKRYVIDGQKMVLLREEGERVDACTFEQYEVYAIDVAMSTGEGKPRDDNTRTTVHKRVVNQTYDLKIKSSRQFFNEVNKRYPTLPFSLRSFSDERAAKAGVRECVQHGLLLPYPALHEKPGAHIAHVKFTVLLLAGGTVKVTGLPLPEGYVTTK